jgi:hypothetical protein
MSYGPCQLRIGDLLLEVEGTVEHDRWQPRVWVDTVHLIHGSERIDISDLLEGVERNRPGWHWRDWLEERVVDDIKRAREVA